MNQVTQTPDTQVVETTVTTTAVAAPAAPKAPSKKSQADVIFANAMTQRAAGAFSSNKAFRAAVLTAIQTQLNVSVASAATMYNSAKKAAEAADANVGLGRDPKKEKPAKVEGARRGRPVGSKNRPKEVAPVATETPAAVEGANVVVIDTPAVEMPVDEPALM
jgi:hypothetical protein